MSSPRSPYDPLFTRRVDPAAEADAAAVGAAFDRASRAYLASPVPWLAWAAVLPGAALATPWAGRALAEAGVLALWSAAILAGGAVEWAVLLRAHRRRQPGPLGAWAMRVQGNLSLVAVALSALLVGIGEAAYLPGVWLLLLGHSFFALGGLAFRPLRVAGALFQLGGLAALLAAAFALAATPLQVFAFASAAGCLWIAWGLWRRDAE